MKDIIGSSHNEKEEKKMTKGGLQETAYLLADETLSEEQEKIQLLSIIKKMPADSLYLILRDYLAKTSQDLDPKLPQTALYSNAINFISGKFRISKQRAASIIFTYRYEMVNNEEVIDKFIDSNNDESEQYDNVR